MEAAVALGSQKTNRVTLSYRQSDFTRIKSRNQTHLQEQIQKGIIFPLLQSQVRAIEERSVILETPKGRTEIKNDAVIVSIGGEMPFEFLERLGISFHREAVEESAREGEGRGVPDRKVAGGT